MALPPPIWDDNLPKEGNIVPPAPFTGLGNNLCSSFSSYPPTYRIHDPLLYRPAVNQCPPNSQYYQNIGINKVPGSTPTSIRPNFFTPHNNYPFHYSPPSFQYYYSNFQQPYNLNFNHNFVPDNSLSQRSQGKTGQSFKKFSQSRVDTNNSKNFKTSIRKDYTSYSSRRKALSSTKFRVEDTEDVEKWIAERKRNYPTKENIEKKNLKISEQVGVSSEPHKTTSTKFIKKRKFKKETKNKNATTPLLPKLLEKDIRKEHSLLIQCIRFLSETNFFKSLTSESK